MKLTTNLQLLHTLKKGTCVSRQYIINTTSFISFADAEVSRDLLWMLKVRYSFPSLKQKDAVRVACVSHVVFCDCNIEMLCKDQGQTLRPVAQLVEALCYKPEGRVFNSRRCLLKCFHRHNPSVDSASNRSEYYEYFLGVNSADD